MIDPSTEGIIRVPFTNALQVSSNNRLGLFCKYMFVTLLKEYLPEET